jgi:hypothetical protein
LDETVATTESDIKQPLRHRVALNKIECKMPNSMEQADREFNFKSLGKTQATTNFMISNEMDDSKDTVEILD